MKRLRFALLMCSLIGTAACGSQEQESPPGAPDQEPAGAAAPAESWGADQRATGVRYSRIPPDQVDQQLRSAAESFARRYEQTRAQGEFEPLGPEATDELRTALTVREQELAQREIAETYGEFKSLEYAGAWRANASPKSTIYRFRARFTKGRPEIRVVHDAAGKVSGLWLKPWRDSLEPPQPQKLAENQVNTVLRDASGAFASSYLERCRAGRFESLGHEATDELRAALTPDKQRLSHAAIAAELGEFQSLVYVETYRLKDEPGSAIFRFRGNFSRGRPEVRVVRDAEGKVSGLWIKPWQDRLN